MYDSDLTDQFSAPTNFIDHEQYIADWPTLLEAETFNSENPLCPGNPNGEITILASSGTVSNPFDYNITLSGPVNISSIQNGSTIETLLAGSYTVQVEDNNGCTASTNFTLIDPPQLLINPFVTSNYNGADIECAGDNNGTVNATTTGGTLPINSIIWEDSNGNTVNPNQLSAGTYTASTTDANGCEADNQVTLTDPQQLLVSTIISSDFNGANISCNGSSDGEITASTSGGTGTIDFAWNPAIGQSTSVVNALSAGTYTVTVTDDNSCTASSTETCS